MTEGFFGGAEHPGIRAINLSEALDYLSAAGFADGELANARASVRTATGHSAHSFEPLNAEYCDFCFVLLMGGEMDVLKDGRQRCIRCSRSVVRSQRDFAELFYETRSNMETIFRVSFTVPLKLRMVNARQIARHTGEVFVPIAGVSPRVLGFAERSRSGYSLFIENGSPALAAVTTISHELCHIWQYENWDERQILLRYGPRRRLEVYEGMATWAQVQYLYGIREFERASRQEAYAAQRDDEYGVGFRAYCEQYPLNRLGVVGSDTPLHRKFPL